MGMSENEKKEFNNMNKIFKEIAGPRSKTAIGVLLTRFAESQKFKA